jgi:hypothetical protein
MKRVFNPFHFVLIAMAGWMNQRQCQPIDYLHEENRLLREQLANGGCDSMMMSILFGIKRVYCQSTLNQCLDYDAAWCLDRDSN